MLYIHRLDPTRHAAFLAEQRKDPVTRKAFAPGDEIVVCAACGSAFSVDSWNYVGGEHDGQSETLREITQEPVTLRGRRLRMTDRDQVTPLPESRTPPGLVLLDNTERAGFLTPIVVVILLGVLAWLVSLALEKRSQGGRQAAIEATSETPQSPVITPPSEREIEAARLAALGERSRVEQGLLGEWAVGSSRLTITREDATFAAVYRFPDPGPFSRGEARQTLRGELQSDNELKLTNIYHGKLANPLDYFSGDFDGVVFVSLSQDGASVVARLSDGRTIVLNRTSVAQPETTNSAETSDGDQIVELHTTSGEIHIRLFRDAAPEHVRNFIALASRGFYEGTKFHRVIPGFVIQGGDPNTISGDRSTWGTGGSGDRLPAEFNDIPHKRGIVSMARSQDRDSASSQFFICVAESRFLDREYTVFGEVIDGMDVVDRIVGAKRDASDRPLEPTSISRVVMRNETVPSADERQGDDAAISETNSDAATNTEESIVHVDRSAKPDYSDIGIQNRGVSPLDPDLEDSGPSEFDVAKLETVINAKERRFVYADLKASGQLSRCLNIQDLEAIKERGPEFFRKYLGTKTKGRKVLKVYAWKSIVEVDSVPFMNWPQLSGQRSRRKGLLMIPYLWDAYGSVHIRWAEFNQGYVYYDLDTPIFLVEK